ncbi:MAG: hypothetical protein QW478_01650 [Candidatus Micrarchaeaceae archaeon]
MAYNIPYATTIGLLPPQDNQHVGRISFGGYNYYFDTRTVNDFIPDYQLNDGAHDMLSFKPYNDIPFDSFLAPPFYWYMTNIKGVNYYAFPPNSVKFNLTE